LKEKIEAQSSELDLKAAEILTSEQNKIWEECRAKLIQLQVEDDLATLKGGEDGAIERSRLDNYLQAAKLTAEQAQKLIEIEGQLDAERRKLVEANKQISQDEQRQNWLPKFQEYDKQFAECLTAEQKAALSRRTARPGQAPR
jgi:Spy/CpxP family protein refolding chaperone